MTDTIRIAIPSVGEGGLDGERSGHFGHCDCFTLIDVENGEISTVTVIENPPHVQGGCLRPVEHLAAHKVDALVVAGMGARPLEGFNNVGIDVYFENVTPGIGDVVSMLLEGGLPVMDSRNVCSGH